MGDMARDKESQIHSIIRRLYECQGLKFGKFTLKSGVESPIYIDLRVIISQPDLMMDICREIHRVIEEKNLAYNVICGVPYTALTIATGISAEFNKPMVMRRKEMKNYGTKQMLEGVYEEGQKALIIEDLIVSGQSIMETALVLQQAGLKVTDAMVFIDRQQNGINLMKQFNINVHSVITLEEVLKFLHEEGFFGKNNYYEESMDWIKANPAKTSSSLRNAVRLVESREPRLGFSERMELSQHELTRRIFRIMHEKETNLCVAADLTKAKDILHLAEVIGPKIVMLKTHIDIVDDFSEDFIHKLQAIAKKHDFLLFEDRKFADIGTTVAHQYSSGVYKIASWADIVNAHMSPGPGIVAGLKKVAAQITLEKQQSRGCLLISSLSSAGNLVPAEYQSAAYDWAIKNSDFVIGFICQKRVSHDPQLIGITPGVKIIEGNGMNGDSLGQQYISPEDAIQQRGADIIVVGRGITSKVHQTDEELLAEAEKYREAGFRAYMATL